MHQGDTRLFVAYTAFWWPMSSSRAQQGRKWQFFDDWSPFLVAQAFCQPFHAMISRLNFLGLHTSSRVGFYFFWKFICLKFLAIFLARTFCMFIQITPTDYFHLHLDYNHPKKHQNSSYCQNTLLQWGLLSCTCL